MSAKVKNPKRTELEKSYQELHNQYQLMATKYGDASLKIRYWNEQKQKLEEQIDKMGEKQKALEIEMQNEPEEIDATSGDRAADQTAASDSNG